MAEQYIFCLIVGAGMTGVALGDALLQTGTLQRDELVLVDRNDDFGGVWESNRYPGAACDIASHAYVMGSCLNPTWSQTFSEGREIQQYYARYAGRHDLRRLTHFHTLVHEARWDAAALQWAVLTEDLHSGQRMHWRATVLVDNGGGFHRPKYASIPGRDVFAGRQWHTALWPEDAVLDGQRVAIIGTGPSAAQVAPAIQPRVQQMYMFQRSCGHVLPRNNQPVPSWLQWLFSWCYPVLWLYHVWWVVFFDYTRDMWLSGTKANQAAHDACIRFLEAEVHDPATREKLRPHDQFGCKRVLFLDTWYRMYNAPNVELVTDAPVRLTAHGIVSRQADGTEAERPIDVLVWGTGFDMNDSGGHFPIYGLDGRTLSQTWRDYPETYRSVAVTGFPNLLLTLGPNSTNYWSNITTVVQIQVRWHCKVLRRIKRETRTDRRYALYPDATVQKQYNNWLRDNRGHPSFLAPACATYHKTPAGATPMYNHFRIWNYMWAMLWPMYGEFVEIREKVDKMQSP